MKVAFFLIPMVLALGSKCFGQGVVGQGPSEQTSASGNLIVPGARFGPLRLGQTREEVDKVYPFRANYDQEFEFFGVTWLNLVSPGFQVYLRDGVVIQIERRAKKDFHTVGGVTYGSELGAVQSEFNDLVGYASMIPRGTVYWVGERQGIAFELHFDERTWSYRVFGVIVFPPGTQFRMRGVEPIDDAFMKLGVLGLPPTGAEPNITQSVASETVRDELLENAVRNFAREDPLVPAAFYFYNRVDLNGDSEPEVLLYLISNKWCGVGPRTCNYLLMQKVGEAYEVTDFFGVADLPIIVSMQRTNGWNDLILWNYSSGVEAGYYSVLKFDGSHYPRSPWGQPELDESVEGTRYMDNPVERAFGVVIGQ